MLRKHPITENNTKDLIEEENHPWISEIDNETYPIFVFILLDEMNEKLNRYKHILNMVQQLYNPLEDDTIQKEKKDTYLQMIQILKIAIYHQTNLCKQFHEIKSVL